MPGSLAGAFAAYAGPQKKPVIDRSLLSESSDVAVIENQACARKVALAATIWDSCIHQTIQIGEHLTDAGNYAASEIAAVLGCSKTVADTYAEIGMDLRLRFPAIRAAFESGELDLQRVRAIYRVTNPYSVDAVERAEAEILTAATRLSPGPLATEIDAIMHRCAPEEAAELRKDLTRLTGVRYRDKDMIATIEANLEAADAAACWQLINEMADTLCPRDPRTRGQRRAAAYTALMRRETYVACTCEPDGDHPCTANPVLPERRRPLTNVTIDIDTLLGLADLPAYLAGHGDIDADYARELAENSDLQIILTEALDLARELGLIANGPADDSADCSAGPSEIASSAGGTTTAAADDSAGQGTDSDDGGTDSDGDSASQGDDEPTEDVDLEAQSANRPAAHLTFNPLGRGRRRRGMRLPKPAPSPTPTRTDVPSGPHEGRYTLIAALEQAIAADPALAIALYPNGHGGFDAPPLGALLYRPGAQLAELVRQRDRTCRHPGCHVPASNCEIDHVIPFNHRNPSRGGWTILTNLHCLCKYHHSLKTMGAWTPTMLAGAAEYWESSSGTTSVTIPGNAYGTTNFAGKSLIPHVPRKRRPEFATEPVTTAERAATAASTAPAATGSGTRSGAAAGKPAGKAAAGKPAADTATRATTRDRNRPTSPRVSGKPAETERGRSETGGGEANAKRPRIQLEPIVECNASMGIAIGLTVGYQISRYRGDAPF